MGVIAKYKFNNTLEANLLPEFNSEFTSDLYTVTDEVNGEVTTRTIESDSLPTLMRFGAVNSSVATERSKSLLEIISLDISNCDNLYHYFRWCTNLTTVNGLIVYSGITNLDNTFGNCNSLEFVDTSNWDTSNVTYTNHMFNNCNNLASLDVSNWDTSNVTNMNHMFYNCNNLTSLDVSNWNTSKVTNMNSIFDGCTSLTQLDVSNWNTSEVTSMQAMFSGCQMTRLDISNWNTSKVTNMRYMFGAFSVSMKLTELDLSNFNTSNVTNMDSMFSNCTNLTSLDVSNFDTNNVASMGSMFNNCNSLTSLDVSNFNTSNVTTMAGMFANMTNLTSLRCPNLTTDSLTSIGRIFKGNTNLATLDISNLSIDTSVVTDYTEIFLESPNIKYIKCNNTDTINLVTSQLPTRASDNQGTIICKSDTTNLDTDTLESKYWNILDEPTLIAKYVFDKSIHNNCIPEFNTGFEGYFIEDEVVEGNNEVTRIIESCGMLPTKVRFGNSYAGNDYSRRTSLLKMLNICKGLTSCHDMFAQCSNLISVCDIDTSKVTNMSTMFNGCNNLTTLDVSNWDTSKVTDMNYMFFYCANLVSLDLSSFDTSNVTDMNGMFQSCVNLTSLDLTSFDTSNVINMSSMFHNCYVLTSIGDISHWNVGNVKDMGSMFYECYELIELNAKNWDVSNVIDMRYMFYNCQSLISLDLSNWDMINVTDTTNMFNNTPLLTDIGVLYMDKSSLQKLVNTMPTDSNKTLWYKDVDIDEITHGDNIRLKKYIEENVEIVLNSPLLEGDTIEVVDGKLCHMHRCEKVVLDGSVPISRLTTNSDTKYRFKFSFTNIKNATSVSVIHTSSLISDKYTTGSLNDTWFNINSIALDTISGVTFYQEDTCTKTVEGFKQWLQANPATVVYELAEPYYEDITPYQSSLILRTFEECNIKIITALPIKTKITYRTNITSAVVMEQELDTLDSGVSLSNLIEEEVDE